MLDSRPYSLYNVGVPFQSSTAVVQQTVNLLVVGSIPTSGAITKITMNQRDPWKEQYFGPIVYTGKVYPREYTELDAYIDKLNGVAEKQQVKEKVANP